MENLTNIIKLNIEVKNSKGSLKLFPLLVKDWLFESLFMVSPFKKFSRIHPYQTHCVIFRNPYLL